MRRISSLVVATIVACVFAIPAATSPLVAQPRIAGVYMGGTPIPGYDSETRVFREHIEVVLPPTYLRVRHPDPPVRGYYAWKFSFGRNAIVTLVFRTDTALLASDDKSVLRASKLYLCRDSNQWLLDCTIPVRATSRTGSGGIVVDITEPQIVARIRETRPGVLMRQLIEPGGRFRVDEIGIEYNGK